MNRSVALALALAVAFPVLAEETEKKTDPSVQAAPKTVEDSPLVRAAKRANRRGRKSTTVITNDSLKGSKGHITTTSVQRNLDIAPAQPTPAEVAAKQAANQAAEQQRIRAAAAADGAKREAKQQQKQASSAADAEEGMFDQLEDDPAATEYEAEKAAAEKAQAEKPPQR